MKQVRRKLGLIVNPVAGIGGSVGLKGSDGEAIQRRAVELGANPAATGRAERSLHKILPSEGDIALLTCAGTMGEVSAKNAGWVNPVIVFTPEILERTNPQDTRRAAERMLDLGADLLLFAGGDGTARDIASVIGDRLPVIGIPAGVKIHSAVFATAPETAGVLAIEALSGKVLSRLAEVMDIDEELFRLGQVHAQLYGYLRVPYRRNLVQGAKSGSEPSDESAQESAAREVVRRLEPDDLLILGPGTTTRTAAKLMGLEKTLLGVDAYFNGQIAARDASEKELLELIKDRKAKILVTPIGGQGHIFGRGNQQISAEVIRRVGKENIIIISTREKIHSLRGRPMFTDTGDRNMDEELSGYIRVVTGYREEIVYPLKCG